MKIHSLALLSLISSELRSDGSRIVLAHGCFDVPHVGHARHLQAAKRLGDVLIVTITSDAHVAKGPDRPAFPAVLRCEAIAAMSCVDYVAICDSPTAAIAIQAIRPHIYVKGPEALSSPSPGLLAEIAMVREIGSEIAYTDDVVFSSTEILRRLG